MQLQLLKLKPSSNQSHLFQHWWVLSGCLDKNCQFHCKYCHAECIFRQIASFWFLSILYVSGGPPPWIIARGLEGSFHTPSSHAGMLGREQGTWAWLQVSFLSVQSMYTHLTLPCRYCQIPTFRWDTICCFSWNVSEMKHTCAKTFYIVTVWQQFHRPFESHDWTTGRQKRELRIFPKKKWAQLIPKPASESQCTTACNFEDLLQVGCSWLFQTDFMVI